MDFHKLKQTITCLQQCSNLESGKALHHTSLIYSFDINSYVASALMKMYSKCRSMERAQHVFDSLNHRNTVIWTCLLSGYVDNGKSLIALKSFSIMDCKPDEYTYACVLKACGNLASETALGKSFCLELGMSIHKQLKGCQLGVFVETSLLDMYIKCDSMAHARRVFDRMVHRNVVAWNTLLLGYVKNGDKLITMDLFTYMDCKPCSITYIAILKACAALAREELLDKHFCLEKGRDLHNQIIACGWDSDISLCTTFIDMYCKCGDMEIAKKTFDNMTVRSVVSWNSLIMGYVDNGEMITALDVFSKMDCEPSSVTYMAVLKACGGLAVQMDKEFWLEKGMAIHTQLKAKDVESDALVVNALIDMYVKCGSMDHARAVLQRNSRNVIAWNSIMQGYVERGDPKFAVDLFACLDCEPSSVTYINALRAFGSLASNVFERQFSLEKVIEIHQQINAHGYDTLLQVQNTLVSVYGQCGSMCHANRVFESMAGKNIVSWNALLLGYVENRDYLLALDLYSRLDCRPSSVTYVALLKACARLANEKGSDKQSCLVRGMEVHKHVKDWGLDSDVAVGALLVDMYSKCGRMDCAREVFDWMTERNVIVWSALIHGYVENGSFSVALDLFANMDCVPDAFTYVAVLRAIGGLAREEELARKFCFEIGSRIHKEARKRGFDTDIVVATALLRMYSQCGNMQHARRVFDTMIHRDIVAWSSLMLGYVENGENLAAVDLYTHMDCDLDGFTCVTILKACVNAGEPQFGREIHARVYKVGLENDQLIATSLIEFYVKSGKMNQAEVVFNNMNSPDVVCWTILITGYSSCGNSSQLCRLTRRMLDAGFRMDGALYTSILMACSHYGLVVEGKLFFQSILRDGLSSLEHYNCMVDILCRANRHHEAIALVNSMPFEADAVTWRILLPACKNDHLIRYIVSS